MNLLVTGASGLIGQAICHDLIQKNHQITVLTRNSKKNFSFPCEKKSWDELNDADLSHIQGVIHLCGHSVFSPWTRKNKKKILESRVNRTKDLFNSMKNSSLEFYLGASAMGYYKPGENLSENSPSGDSFLSKVCMEWEKEHERFRAISKRLIITRFSVVLSPHGAFLKNLLFFLKLKILPQLSKKDFYFSWISLEDLTQSIHWILFEKKLQGIFNLSSPKAYLFKQVMRKIAKKYQAFMLPPMPEFLLCLFFGKERFKDFMSASYQVIPQKLKDLSYPFKHKNLNDYLED